MTRVALLSPSVVQADAVSNDVLGMYNALIARGHDVQVFAGTVEGIDEPGVGPAAMVPDFLRKREDVLIYHHAIGWEQGVTLLEKVKCRRVVKYHNVTPPEFFEGISDQYLNVCRMGKEQLKAVVRAGCDRYLYDSEYNLRETVAQGVAEAHSAVVYPFHHTDRLHALEADLHLLDAYRDGKTNLLAVGRLAPNKGHALLVAAFAVYHRAYNPHSRLLIVGKDGEGLKRYGGYVAGLAAGLGVEDAVVFTGEVLDRELKAYYLAADVLLVLSEHEGFCLPLAEAMAMKLPVIAHAATAVPGTVGDAGLLLDERDPNLVAAAVDYVIRTEQARVTLARLGWRRYQRHFSNARIGEQFLRALDGLL